MTGVTKNPIVVTELMIGGMSLNLAETIPRSKTTQPKFSVKMISPGTSRKSEAPGAFINTRKTNGMRTRLCAEVYRFLRTVLNTCITCGKLSCLIIASDEMKVMQPSLMVLAINPHKMMLTARKGM